MVSPPRTPSMNLLGLINYTFHVTCYCIWLEYKKSFIHSKFKYFLQSNIVIWYPSWNTCSSWVQLRFLHSRQTTTHEDNKRKTQPTDMLSLHHCKIINLSIKLERPLVTSSIRRGNLIDLSRGESWKLDTVKWLVRWHRAAKTLTVRNSQTI